MARQSGIEPLTYGLEGRTEHHAKDNDANGLENLDRGASPLASPRMPELTIAERATVEGLAAIIKGLTEAQRVALLALFTGGTKE